MSLNIIDARMVNKILTTGTPSIAPSSDHTDGTWIETDAYIAEIVLNTTDDKVWIMGENGPLELAVTTGATSGVFVSGGGTINRLPKFVGSTDIADSVISETGGVVRIDSFGNVNNPVLTLSDPNVGFFGTTGSLRIAINNNEQVIFGDGNTEFLGTVQVDNDLIISGRSFLNGMVVTPTTFTASGTITNNMSFVRVLTSGVDITLTIPSPAGSTPIPLNGHKITIFKQGSAGGDVYLRTNFSEGMVRAGSNVTADSIKIPQAETNITVTIQYIEAIQRWITVSVAPDISDIVYETVL
jgi:cytoskeletal protein CcmA (bactofilin family)